MDVKPHPFSLMKQMFLTLALALTAFAGKAQMPLQMDVDNQSGSGWNVQFYLDDPNGSPDAFYTTPIYFPSGTMTIYSNSGALSWKDKFGNSIPAAGLPPGVQWGKILVANPCGISGNANSDIIKLSTGITGQYPFIPFAQAGIVLNCPANSANQLTGQIVLPGAPGQVGLIIN